jgi:hypothetical protein
MILSVDTQKQRVVCKFHGSLRRTDLLGQNEVLLHAGPYLDDSNLDDLLYLDDAGEQLFIDQPTYRQPYIYVESYIDTLDNPDEQDPDVPRPAKYVENKLVLTW